MKCFIKAESQTTYCSDAFNIIDLDKDVGKSPNIDIIYRIYE